jgi:hypothetical protein
MRIYPHFFSFIEERGRGEVGGQPPYHLLRERLRPFVALLGAVSRSNRPLRGRVGPAPRPPTLPLYERAGSPYLPIEREGSPSRPINRW